MQNRGSLLQRLVVFVALGSLGFAVAAGFVIYYFAYARNVADAASLEAQLVNTVRAQAEVAVFAGNEQIAEGVIEGLRANPRIRAVRIIGSAQDPASPFNVGAGFIPGQDRTSVEYPLFSPVDGHTRIGSLMVVRNQELIQAQATVNALNLTLLLLAQLIPTTALLLLAYRQLVGRPIERLARQLAEVQLGSRKRIEVAPSHANDEIGALSQGANSLIATAENALDEIRMLATTDSLTGLATRRAFLETMSLELARLKRREDKVASVLMFDLDLFKNINDQHGHAAGDATLQEFGRILASELRRIDSGGRLGGEEFAVLLPATHVDDARAFADRVRQRIAMAIVRHESKLLHMTTSIGISEMHAEDSGPEESLARADRALYQAKQLGRDRVEIESTSAS